MQLSNAVFRLLVKSTQGKLSIEELLSRGKITHYYAAFPNSISVPSSTALIESDLMPTVLANVIEHKRGMNTTLQMQHSKHARKEARHLQILLRSSKAKRHKRVFNAGSQTTDTGTIFMSAIQQPLLGIVTDAKRILEGVDFSQRLLNTQSVPSHLACTPPFQARAPRQTLRAEPPLPDPIKIARRGTGGYQQWHPCWCHCCCEGYLQWCHNQNTDDSWHHIGHWHHSRNNTRRLPLTLCLHTVPSTSSLRAGFKQGAENIYRLGWLPNGKQECAVYADDIFW